MPPSPRPRRPPPRVLAALLTLLGCSEPAETTPPVAATRAEVTPSDTAILWPLPASLASSSLLRADAAGVGGALLPLYAYDVLPALSNGGNRALYPQLRVVAANLDPCFPDPSVAEERCRHQIRLVLQPLREADGAVTTDDVTLHAFYEMPRAEFVELVRAVRRLDGTLSEADWSELQRSPIGVHPVLRREGPASAYWRGLDAALLAHAGAGNLVKVTFSALRGTGMGWQMGGFDYQGEHATEIEVPEANAFRQELINGATDGASFAVSVEPRTVFSDRIEALFRSESARSRATSAEVRAAYAQALRFDNPEGGAHPGNMDCASCHIATPLRLWAERELGLRAADFAENYTSVRWNLALTSETQRNTLSTRCFGYYGRQVAISFRTVNEAAATADYINQRLLGRSRTESTP